MGNAAGCLPFLGIPANDPDANNKLLTALNNPNSGLGNELKAIRGPSAVISSSALGGGMQSLQPVKTVTQFRLARNRIDQRLTSKPKPTPPRKDAAGPAGSRPNRREPDGRPRPKNRRGHLRRSRVGRPQSRRHHL